MRKVKKQQFILLFIALTAFITLGSWFVQRMVEAETRTEVGKFLHTQLNTTHQAVKSWLNEHRSEAALWATSPKVVSLTHSLLTVPPSQDKLWNASSQQELKEFLYRVYKGKGYQGYFIIGPGNINLASSRKENIGKKSLLEKQPQFLERVWSGHIAVSLPQKSDVPLPDKTGKLKEGLPTMFVGVPIVDESGTVMAVFTFRLNPAEDFTSILQRGRIGETGETYAFDRQGRLISDSRFDEQLRKIGLLSPSEKGIFNIYIRDPGVNLVSGERTVLPDKQQPLTRMAKSATNGQSAMDLAGYRDYRGVPVIGAWLWDTGLGFGITAEVNMNEAYHALYTNRNVLTTATLITILLSGILIGFFYIHRKHLGETESRYQDLFQNANDSIFIIDPISRRFIDVNENAAKRLGYTREELLQLKIDDINLPDRGEYLKQVIKELYEKGSKVFETIHVCKNGDQIPVEISSRIIEVGGQQLLQSFVRDISKRKQAEQLLKRRDAILETVAYSAEQFLKASSWGEHIQEALTLLGNIAQVSRAYIFENHPGADGELLTSQRYEWVAKGISKQIDNPQLQHVSIRDKGFFRWEEILGQGEVIHGHIREFPELEKQSLGSQEIQSILIVPIMVNGKWWGSIGFDECLTEREWSSIEIDSLKALADILGAAIGRMLAEDKNRELLKQNRHLTKRMFGLQEAERRHLAQELHDEFGQWLTAIQADAQLISNLSEHEKPQIHASARAISSSAKEVQKGVHGMIRQLRPSLLDDLGLIESLREHVSQWQKRHSSIHCNLDLDGELSDLGETLNITLYRIVQESLTNIARHAQATQAVISISRDQDENGDMLFLHIEDDGKGMTTFQNSEGLGLTGMRERVLAEGGSFTLNNAESGGVSINIKLPAVLD